MNTGNFVSKDRLPPEFEFVTVTQSAVRATLGGSGVVAEVDATGGSRFG